MGIFFHIVNLGQKPTDVVQRDWNIYLLSDWGMRGVCVCVCVCVFAGENQVQYKVCEHLTDRQDRIEGPSEG